eukprot:2240704-Pyramimonas_sp.AAC.1
MTTGDFFEARRVSTSKHGLANWLRLLQEKTNCYVVHVAANAEDVALYFYTNRILQQRWPLFKSDLLRPAAPCLPRPQPHAPCNSLSSPVGRARGALNKAGVRKAEHSPPEERLPWGRHRERDYT